MSNKSGPTQSEEARRAAGRVKLNMWVSEKAHARLEALVAAGFADSKTGVIERLLLELGGQVLMWSGAGGSETLDSGHEDGPGRAFEDAPAPGSPGALARAVRAKGPRREATEVRTGKRVREGRTER